MALDVLSGEILGLVYVNDWNFCHTVIGTYYKQYTEERILQ